MRAAAAAVVHTNKPAPRHRPCLQGAAQRQVWQHSRHSRCDERPQQRRLRGHPWLQPHQVKERLARGQQGRRGDAAQQQAAADVEHNLQEVQVQAR